MTRQRLFVAYILRGRKADEVNGLRRALGSSELDRIAPHITIVPPVNVETTAVDDASRLIVQVASVNAPISLRLGGPLTFPPDHHVLYLRVVGELDRLSSLRNQCYQEPLVPSSGREQRPFVPHVSLRSHLDAEVAISAAKALSSFDLAITVDRLALFCLDESTTDRRWRVIDEVVLGGVVTLGRGGREITIVQATMYNRQDQAFVDRGGMDQVVGHREARRVVLRSLIDGELVGLCSGIRYGTHFVIEQFVIDQVHRRSGIGRQLNTFLERLATDLSICELSATVPNESVVFFTKCGYQSLDLSSSDGRSSRVVRVLARS